MIICCLLSCQFDCTNTLNDQVLERVTVDMEAADGFEVVKQIACSSLRYNKPGTTYTLARLPEDPTTGSLQDALFFPLWLFSLFLPS